MGRYRSMSGNFSSRATASRLDDFVYSDDWIPLLEIADISCKLDVLEMDLDDCLQRSTPETLPAKILAEKVEPSAVQGPEKSWLRLFPGHFFPAGPISSRAERIGVNQAAALKLICAIKTPDVQFRRNSVKSFPGTSASATKLLHYINSAFSPCPTK